MRLIDADIMMELVGRLPFRNNEDIKNFIEVQPTVDAEPIRHGRWKKICENNFKCSECCAWYVTTVFEEEIKDFRYCPNCGAKMDLTDHYCDRNKCLQMEYNSKGCAECEVTE